MKQPPNGRPEGFAIVEKLLRKIGAASWLEVGTTRQRDDMGAGYSTPFFAWLASETGSTFCSVDIKPSVIETARAILRDLGLESFATLVCADAREYVQKLKHANPEGKVLAMVYLDALDYDGDDDAKSWSELWHLLLFNDVEPLLADGAVVLIDDVYGTETFEGKGRLLIPSLLERGYECVHRGYQFVFIKPSAAFKPYTIELTEPTEPITTPEETTSDAEPPATATEEQGAESGA